MNEYYYCNCCGTEISTEDIMWDKLCCTDICPECGSEDVDYFEIIGETK